MSELNPSGRKLGSGSVTCRILKPPKSEAAAPPLHLLAAASVFSCARRLGASLHRPSPGTGSASLAAAFGLRPPPSPTSSGRVDVRRRLRAASPDRRRHCTRLGAALRAHPPAGRDGAAAALVAARARAASPDRRRHCRRSLTRPGERAVKEREEIRVRVGNPFPPPAGDFIAAGSIRAVHRIGRQRSTPRRDVAFIGRADMGRVRLSAARAHNGPVRFGPDFR